MIETSGVGEELPEQRWAAPGRSSALWDLRLPSHYLPSPQPSLLACAPDLGVLQQTAQGAMQHLSVEHSKQCKA